MELWTIFLRTTLIYAIIFLIMRLMGKREIGKLSIFDLVISVMIAEIAVFVIEDPAKPLLYGLLPMVVLVSIQIILAFVELKNQRLRVWLEGKPSVLIRNGTPDYAEMRRQRYNLDDLLQQLREKDIMSVADVEFAILENSGKLTVFKKPDKEFVTREDLGLTVNPEKNSPRLPLPLIMDGVVQHDHLRQIGKSERWLRRILQQQGAPDPKQILYAAPDGNGLFIRRRDCD